MAATSCPGNLVVPELSRSGLPGGFIWCFCYSPGCWGLDRPGRSSLPGGSPPSMPAPCAHRIAMISWVLSLYQRGAHRHAVGVERCFWIFRPLDELVPVSGKAPYPAFSSSPSARINDGRIPWDRELRASRHGTTAGLIPPPPGASRAILSRDSAGGPGSTGSRNSLSRDVPGRATSMAARHALRDPRPRGPSDCSSSAFTLPACFAYARICSSRLRSAVALSGCSPNTTCAAVGELLAVSAWARSARVAA